MTTAGCDGFMEMVIAECPRCGRQWFSWDKEDAIGKYNAHRCPEDWSDEELNAILERILKEQ